MASAARKWTKMKAAITAGIAALFLATGTAHASALRQYYIQAGGDNARYDECMSRPAMRAERCLLKSLKPLGKKYFASCILRYDPESTRCIRALWRAQCVNGDEDACQELCHEPEDNCDAEGNPPGLKKK